MCAVIIIYRCPKCLKTMCTFKAICRMLHEYWKPRTANKVDQGLRPHSTTDSPVIIVKYFQLIKIVQKLLKHTSDTYQMDQKG